jgi:ankyrin repeat protein
VINDVDGIGRTPLMYAVHCEQYESIKCLINLGADVNACAHGKFNIAKVHLTILHPQVRKYVYVCITYGTRLSLEEMSLGIDIQSYNAFQ